MFETESAEKVVIETPKKPFVVCDFLGAFWNICSGASQPVKAPTKEKVPTETQIEPFCNRNTCTDAAAPEVEKKVLLENFEYLHAQGSIGASRKIHYGTEDHLGSTRMVLAQDGTVKEALMYQPYGTVSDVQAISASRADPLRQKFTTKEFDEDGENSENGAPGIDQYYFGARFFDAAIGRWLSCDKYHQFFDSYLYSHSDPVNHLDPDGNMSPLTHFILGLGHGTIYGASPDYWHYDSKRAYEKYPEGEVHRDVASYIHRVYSESMDSVYSFIRGPKPEGLTDAEWKGVKTHLAQDYFNQGIGKRSFSPSERIVQKIGGDVVMGGYQDGKDAILALPFVMPLLPMVDPTGVMVSTIFITDWFIGLLNLNAAQNGLLMMIDKGVYIRGMREGNPKTDLLFSKIMGDARVIHLRNYKTDEIEESYNIMGVQLKK